MLKLTSEEIRERFPIVGLEFYPQGIKIKRKSNLSKKAPRGRKMHIEKLSQSSLSKLAFLGQNTPLKLKSMLTLSYGKIYPSDGYMVKASLNRFLTWLRGRYEKLGYIWFLEFQKRGVPHVHVLLDVPVCEEDRKVVASRWLKSALDHCLTQRDYQAWEVADAALKMFKVHKHGKTWEAIRSDNGARGYIAKYATKTHQKEVPKAFGSVGRFWGNSQNAKPKPLSTQPATEQGVRLYLEAIGSKAKNLPILPKHISTYKKPNEP